MHTYQLQVDINDLKEICDKADVNIDERAPLLLELALKANYIQAG